MDHRYWGIQKMPEKKAPEAAIKYIQFLRNQNPGMIKAYLFGSFAKGNAGRDSDIDIAIVFDDFSDSFDMQVELMKLRRKFDIRIEPHPFRKHDFNVSNPIASDILATGVEIAA